MWLDDSTTNATVVKNTVRSNSSIGIQFELSHKGIVAGNVVTNNGAGIMIADSSDIRVYNNTLAMNDQHLVIKDSQRKNTKAAEVDDGIAWVTRNNVFKNNILSNATGSTLVEAVECSGRQHSKQMITDSDYNAYYRKSSSKPQNLIKWSLGKGKCLVGYDSIATFESATGFEENALVVENVASNPFFVDEANGDFRLKANSSAIGRGEALPTDIATAIGLPSGVPVDLGALQSKVVLE